MGWRGEERSEGWREGRKEGVERRREEGMDRREADRGGCSEEGGRDAGLRKGDRVVEGREGGARETEGGSSEGEKREEEGEGASPQ